MKPDYSLRLEKMRSELQTRRCDAIWVAKAMNRRYLTGFTGSAGWLVIPAAGKPVLITDGRYAQQAGQETQGLKIIISQKNPLAVLSELLRRGKTRVLGFEDDLISVASWYELRRMLPGLKGKGISGAVEALRMIKEPWELACMQKALEQAEKAYYRLLPQIMPGKTERELAVEFEKKMLAAGSDDKAFPIIVASGPNSAMPHATPTDRRLKAGDLLILDFGCTYQGYHSDLTRTLAIGRMTQKQKELYKIVKNAQKSSQKLLISGQIASKSDKKARDIFRKHKLDRFFVHSLGHGVGLEIHEGPRLSSMSRDTLASGMVATCEPGVYLPDWGGIRIEDEVLVQSAAARWLSLSPEDLQVVGRRRKP